MKDYRREYPLFSLCGLNCAFCPMHLDGYCPGCGGGAGHQNCAVIRCSRERGAMEFCTQCGIFPCGRLTRAMEYDSFLPHVNMVGDLKKAGEMGLPAYRALLEEKAAILTALLEGYNDGRRKRLYCTAVNLLSLPALRGVMEELAREAPPPECGKARAQYAVGLLQDAAGAEDVTLTLRKKPKS